MKRNSMTPIPARLIPRRIEVIHEPASEEIREQQVRVVAEMFMRRLRNLDSLAGDKQATGK